MNPPAVDWTPGQRASSALQVHLLGLTDLPAALFLQERLAQELADRHDAFGALLVCEHPLAISIGREGAGGELHAAREELQRRDVFLHWLRRGGGCWVHHPGQLAVYVVAPVERLRMTAAEFVTRLNAALLEVARELGVLAHGVDAPLGVAGRCGQFGFVGAALRDGVSQFGLCLNVSVPRTVLALGEYGPGVRAASLAAERMRPTAMATVREALIRHLAQALHYDHYHLLTGHPLLRRTARRMYVAAETGNPV